MDREKEAFCLDKDGESVHADLETVYQSADIPYKEHPDIIGGGQDSAAYEL